MFFQSEHLSNYLHLSAYIRVTVTVFIVNIYTYKMLLIKFISVLWFEMSLAVILALLKYCPFPENCRWCVDVFTSDCV